MSAGGDQNRVLDPLGLKLQAMVSCLTWVLEVELGSSAEPSLQQERFKKK